LLEVVELQQAVGIILHHALVLERPPARRHRVLVLERVGALVHQRDVALHLQLKPSGAALLAGDAVQVALEVVQRQHRTGPLEVRRAAGVDVQRHGDVHVRQRRVHGHDVAGVLDVESPEVPEGMEGGPEEAVADVRAREHEGRHRARRRAAASGGHVHAVADDVDGVEDGDGGAEAVSGDGDAELLVLVELHQPPHLLEDLIPGASLVELGAGMAGRVQGQEAHVHHRQGVGGGFLAEDRRGGHRREGEVVDPLQALHGAAPGDDDVAPPQRGGALVGGHGDVPHEVGLPGPHVLERRQWPDEEGVREGLP